MLLPPNRMCRPGTCPPTGRSYYGPPLSLLLSKARKAHRSPELYVMALVMTTNKVNAIKGASLYQVYLDDIHRVAEATQCLDLSSWQS
jgi:hypothetical protein